MTDLGLKQQIRRCFFTAGLQSDTFLSSKDYLFTFKVDLLDTVPIGCSISRRRTIDGILLEQPALSGVPEKKPAQDNLSIRQQFEFVEIGSSLSGGTIELDRIVVFTKDTANRPN